MDDVTYQRGHRCIALQAAIAICQHATLDRDEALAERIGEAYESRRVAGMSK